MAKLLRARGGYRSEFSSAAIAGFLAAYLSSSPVYRLECPAAPPDRLWLAPKIK